MAILDFIVVHANLMQDVRHNWNTKTDRQTHSFAICLTCAYTPRHNYELYGTYSADTCTCEKTSGLCGNYTVCILYKCIHLLWWESAPSLWLH